MNRVQGSLFWLLLIVIVAVPVVAALKSPLLEYRSPVYIVAAFAGVIAMVLLLFQPLLAAGFLPGLVLRQGRRIHRYVGSGLVLMIILHVAGLWITSAPDVIDALLFVSPTPFSIWGVIAMWAIFASASLAALRRKLRPRTWRVSHKTLSLVIVAGTVLHAILIEGTMETLSKLVLCVLLVVATGLAIFGYKFSKFSAVE